MRCQSTVCLVISGFVDNRFKAVFQCTPLQQYPPPAGKTFKANISAQAHHTPFIAAAGVRFSQA